MKAPKHSRPTTPQANGIAHAAALRRLRIKFVALNLTTAFVILAVVFTVLCVVDWQRSVDEVGDALTQAVQTAAQQSRSTELQKPPRIGGDDAAHGKTAPASVAVYRVDESDEATLVTSTSTASLEDDVLTKALAQIEMPAQGEAASDGSSDATAANSDATTVNTGGEVTAGDSDATTDASAAGTTTSDAVTTSPTGATGSGTAEGTPPASGALPPDGEPASPQHGTLSDLGLYYAVVITENGTFVAFADVSSTQGWQSLAGTLAAAGVGALAVFFLISLGVSRWALRPVEEAWRAQHAFVADASHELKTPLTVIMANLDIVLSERRSTVADQSRWIEGARAEANQMQGLVEDMLELAQLDEAERLKDAELVDLSSLAEGTMLELESLFFERDVELGQRIEPDIAVRGHAARLKRLLGTLMDNAQKYAGASGRVTVGLSHDAGRVTVGLSHDAGRAVLTVSNTGAPIPTEDLPHVFDRFYRSNKARTRDDQPGGHGLGLAIAHEIVCEHAGTIDVTSDREAGTTFTVRLPLAKETR